MSINKSLLAGAFAVSVFMIQGCGTTVKDTEGNVYKTVKIGNQVWMAENLRSTKFNDWAPIPKVMERDAWKEMSSPAYCYYGNSDNADSIKKYGALYNWYAVDTKKLAPSGWHVPTDDDWKLLENYMAGNGYNWDGTKSGNKIAKSLASKKGWFNLDTKAGMIGYEPNKNNRSGFSALPGGYRSLDGGFYGKGQHGEWWSATESYGSSAYERSLHFDRESTEEPGLNFIRKFCGVSVRLVRDN